MTLKEMQSIAAETLAFFIQAMPDMPFNAEDIEIEFSTRKQAPERFKALCEKYAPDRPINEHHLYALEHQTFGNAIIGRGKSAALLKIDYKMDRDNLRRVVFHELMHIYCGKTEMDGGHFIDVYGSGHTPDPDPEDKVYDGCVSAGYSVWSEFIAEYYAVTKTVLDEHSFGDIAEPVFNLLGETVMSNEGAKNNFAMVCAYVLSCSDAEDILPNIGNPGFIVPDDAPDGIQAMTALKSCLLYFYEHMQTERPWKITEEFICDLGSKYIAFVIANSMYLDAV